MKRHEKSVKTTQGRAETMWCRIAPYRDAMKQDCPAKIQLILAVNKWINPWHALQELEREIPFRRRQELKKTIGIEMK